MIKMSIPRINESTLLFEEELVPFEKFELLRNEAESGGLSVRATDDIMWTVNFRNRAIKHPIRTIPEGEEEFNVLMRPNKIRIHQPNAQDLVAFCASEQRELLPEIKQNIKAGFNFQYVTLFCMFRPHPDCVYLNASLEIEMECEQEAGVPIVFDLFPVKVVNEIAVKEVFSFTSGFQFKFAEVKLNKSFEKNYMIYEPEICSMGRGGSTAYWDFSATSSKPLSGDKLLFMIVKKPIRAKVSGRFTLKVLAETRERIILPLSRASGNIKKSYAIC